MKNDLKNHRSEENPIRFGRTARGNRLEEYVWGDSDRSILFVSGFTLADRPLAQLLLRWREHLSERETYGGISGEFDLKNLKERCRIRIVPYLNPDICKINRNGLSEKLEKKENNNNFIQETTSNQVHFRGIDLNRNFNSNWIKMHVEDPKRTDCGPFPESEAEVQSFTRRIKNDPPVSAIVLKYGQNALYYPKETDPKEIREAIFLGQYASLPVRPAEDTDGTAFRWLTDRGIKTAEIRWDTRSDGKEIRIRNLLTMCAALT